MNVTQYTGFYHRINMSKYAFLLGFVLTLPSLSVAENLPEGLWIMEQVNAVKESESMVRNLTMTTIDRRGKKRVRQTLNYQRYFGEEKRTVLFYLSPKNVKDTAFLTYDYVEKNRDDDQWLYLPALRKARRISASDRGDYFLGTDFTYEDLKREGKPEVSDYIYTTLTQETWDNKVFYVVEAKPINASIAKELGYGKVKSWVNEKTWMIEKAEYWDINMNSLKTMLIDDIRIVDGFLTRHTVDIENHKTKHSTRFKFSNIDYSTPIADSLFTRQAITRGVPKP